MVQRGRERDRERERERERESESESERTHTLAVVVLDQSRPMLRRVINRACSGYCKQGSGLGYDKQGSGFGYVSKTEAGLHGRVHGWRSM
jgi:hypothetical protein